MLFRSTVNALGKAVNHSAHRVGMEGRQFADKNKDAPKFAAVQTLGWTDCGHDDWRPGVTLDPFCGTGTTMAVAEHHGRDAIGFDLDPRNKANLWPLRRAEVFRSLGLTIPTTNDNQTSLFDITEEVA